MDCRERRSAWPPGRGVGRFAAQIRKFAADVDFLDRTMEDRWADVERFLEVDWEGNLPGPRVVEAVEALVDDWWNARPRFWARRWGDGHV